jgi:chromosome partitioning protein
VAPSHIDLAGGEAELTNRISREHILATAIDGVRDRYDFLLLDCQPSLGLLTVNALCAADEVLIPIEAQMYALLGMTQLQNTVRLIQHRANRRLKVTGVLVTKYDPRTTATREFMERLDRFLASGYRLLEARIGSTTRVREAEMQQQSIMQYDPRSPVALAYGRLADEVLGGC